MSELLHLPFLHVVSSSKFSVPFAAMEECGSNLKHFALPMYSQIPATCGFAHFPLPQRGLSCMMHKALTVGYFRHCVLQFPSSPLCCFTDLS